MYSLMSVVILSLCSPSPFYSPFIYFLYPLFKQGCHFEIDVSFSSLWETILKYLSTSKYLSTTKLLSTQVKVVLLQLHFIQVRVQGCLLVLKNELQHLLILTTYAQSQLDSFSCSFSFISKVTEGPCMCKSIISYAVFTEARIELIIDVLSCACTQ